MTIQNVIFFYVPIFAAIAAIDLVIELPWFFVGSKIFSFSMN